MKTKTLLFIFISLVFISSSVQAANTEQLIRKALVATNDVSRGNYAGAATQALPSTSYGKGTTNVRLNGSSVGVHQGVPGLSKFGNKYVNVNPGFNAYGHLNSKGQPTIGRNFQVSTGNKHIRNNTTFE